MSDHLPDVKVTLAGSLRRLAGWSMWTSPKEPDAERRSDVRNLLAAYEDNLNKLEEIHDAHDTLERENDRLRKIETAWDGIFGERDAENAADWVVGLLAEKSRLSVALQGVASCSSCSVCRGAATRALRDRCAPIEQVGTTETTGDAGK